MAFYLVFSFRTCRVVTRAFTNKRKVDGRARAASEVRREPHRDDIQIALGRHTGTYTVKLYIHSSHYTQIFILGEMFSITQHIRHAFSRSLARSMQPHLRHARLIGIPILCRERGSHARRSLSEGPATEGLGKLFEALHKGSARCQRRLWQRRRRLNDGCLLDLLRRTLG